LAQAEDGEQLRERAQEGRVGLKEEVAEANRKLLRLKDLFERIEATNEFSLGSVMISATKYDMLPHMMSRPMCRARIGCARAYGDIFSSQTKTVQVVHIKTVCNCNTEKGRSDEAMAHSNSALYARRGFIAICYIIYQCNVATSLLIVRDDKLAVGDDEDEDCQGKGMCGSSCGQASGPGKPGPGYWHFLATAGTER